MWASYYNICVTFKLFIDKFAILYDLNQIKTIFFHKISVLDWFIVSWLLKPTLSFSFFYVYNKIIIYQSGKLTGVLWLLSASNVYSFHGKP